MTASNGVVEGIHLTMADTLKFPNAECSAAWVRYVAAENTGSAEEKLGALEAFVSVMALADGLQRIDFVESYCRRYLDRCLQLPIAQFSGEQMRLPLFRGVFAEILEEGRQRRKPCYARWSADFHHLFSRRRGEYAPYRPSAAELLNEALDIDPGDARARSRLLVLILDWVDYVCHELPESLLCEPTELVECAARLEALGYQTVWEERLLALGPPLISLADGDRTSEVLSQIEELVGLRDGIRREFPGSRAPAER